MGIVCGFNGNPAEMGTYVVVLAGVKVRSTMLHKRAWLISLFQALSP